MRKYFIVSFILLTAAASLAFSADPIPPASDKTYAAIAVPYSKTSARMDAMGGAGIAGFSNRDALYINPAALANPGFVINTPSLTLKIHDFKAVEKTGVIETITNNPGQFGDSDYVDTIFLQLISVYGSLKNNAMGTMEAGIGAKLGPFAMAFDTKCSTMTYTPGDALSLKAIPMTDMVFSAGLGYRFFKGSAISLDAGIAARLDLRGYWKAIEAMDIFLHMGEDGYMSSLPEKTPMMCGFAIPLDIGLNLNLPFDLTLSAVVKNINGSFHMRAYDNYSQAEKAGIGEVFKNSTFSFSTPLSFNLGFGWNPDFKAVANYIRPSIVIDFTGVNKLFTGSFSENLKNSIRAGVEVELCKTFELRAGVNQGRFAFGLGLNLINVLHLEASYYQQAFISETGTEFADTLTLRFNTIWE